MKRINLLTSDCRCTRESSTGFGVSRIAWALVLVIVAGAGKPVSAQPVNAQAVNVQPVNAQTVNVLPVGQAVSAQDAAAPTRLLNRNNEPPVPLIYTLAPGDEITIRSLQAKEITDKLFHIDGAGEVNLPLLGRLHVGGLTPHQAEALLQEKLKAFYVEPDVAVDVTAMHAEPVSVIGAVGAPGMVQMRGAMTLLDVLSLAGGVRPNAGASIRVTRDLANGSIPHPSAYNSGPDTSVALINLKDLMDLKSPTDNIQIKPHDTISLPPAELIYVIGNVRHQGGFTLDGKGSITVLQALALAEGYDARASPQMARIIRRADGQPEKTIRIDAKRIFQGKEEDIRLQPNDILLIPNSTAKTVTARTIEAAVQIAVGLSITGRF